MVSDMRLFLHLSPPARAGVIPVPPVSARRRTTGLLTALVAIALVPLALVAAPARADVVTYGADNLRTAWYPDQTTLSPGLVSGGTFGQMWNNAITGQVYAQPVVSQGTAFVATETNDIYGFDATSGATSWHRNVGVPFNAADVTCGDLAPTIGITGTPVVDPATNVAYFFAKTYASGTSGPAAYYVHAVSVATGAEQPGFPVLIAGSDNSPTNPRAFDAQKELQRPGLLLLNGVVYAGFGGHCDRASFTGWVVGVSTAGSITTMWNAEIGETGNPGAGIWQSGGGLVSDGPNQILLTTGNGHVPATATPGATPPRQLAQSVVRLVVQPDKSLKATDFFMPYDAAALNSWDADLGSGGPVVLPPASFGTPAYPHLELQIGKQGFLDVLNADDLGGYKQGPSGSDRVIQRLGPFGGVWSKPTPWGGDGGYVYVTTASGGNSASGSSGFLQALKYGVDGNGKPTFSLAGSSADAFGFSSSSPVVTSSGTTSGSALVWVIWSAAGNGLNAQLRAYDPVPVNGVMQLRWSTPIGTSSKFAVPSVSGNRIFVGTRDGHIKSFGSPVNSPLVGAATTFPTTTIGQTATQSVTITANYDLDVSAVAVSGSNFTAGSSTPPAPTHLAKDATITVPVTYTPTTTDLDSGSLTITTSSGPVSFGLSGSGQLAAAEIVANPESVSMGGAVVGGSPITASVTFHNSGAQPLVVNSVALPASPFGVSGVPAVGSTVAPGQDVITTFTFTPTAAGFFTDVLSLSTTGGDIDVPVSATATAPPHLQLSTTNVAYGAVPVGSSSSQSFTVTNTGGAPLSITRSKPPVGAMFTTTTNINEGTTVAPGASVTGTVVFAPTAAGPTSATWELNGNDDSGVQTVTFTGTGTGSAPIVPPAAGGWQLNGSSVLSGSTLVLTPPATNQAGTAFWPSPVPTQDFTTSFDETMDQGTGADGIALVFADPAAGALPTSLGHDGGGLGYSGIPGVAATLDTYKNVSDPSGNFVGIATGGTGDQITYLATNSSIAALTSSTHHVTITYTAGVLTMYLDGAQVLSSPVAIPANALIGFAGATGASTDRQSVTNVTFGTLAPGTLTVSPGTLDFGPVTSGTTAGAAVQVTNTGQTPVTLTSTSGPTGPFTTPARPANGTVVAAGASVTVPVVFSPSFLGTKTGTFAFTGNDGKTTALALTGISQTVVWAPGFGGWTFNGSAKKAASDIELTAATPNVAGSLFWPTPIDPSFLSVDFDATMKGGNGGNGIAVAFADATKTQPTALGGLGGGIGWNGISGFAAILDTNQNVNEPSSNFVGYAQSYANGQPTYVATNTAIPDLRAQTRHVRVVASRGRVVMSIEGAVALDRIASVPASVLLGFTSATGNRFDRHSIKNVVITTAPSVGAPLPGAWTANGSATIAANGAQLTTATANTAGSVFPTATVSSAGLSVAFDATINGGSGGSGLALALAPATAAVTSLGAAGDGLGWAGLPGLAVVLDTHQNGSDPSGNFVGVATGAVGNDPTYVATSTTVPPLAGGTHHIVVSVFGDHLHVAVDGTQVIDVAVSLPATVRPGFTAGSGALTDAHAVSNVSIGS